MSVRAARTAASRRTLLLDTGVDWRRLLRRAVCSGALVLTLLALALSIAGGDYAADFRGGTWQAAHAILAGRSPYLSPEVTRILAHPHAFMMPPPLAVLATPLALLPFWLAALLWSVLCGGGLFLALRCVGVSDRRVYAAAFCSFPFASSLIWGHPDGLLVLAAAATWRYRDSWKGGAAAGALIAAKLLAWPLVLWLLLTTRRRSALVAVVSAISLLAATWACAGFRGFTAYPQLLAADARAWEKSSYSLIALLAHAGMPLLPARALAVVFALAIACGAVRLARGSDHGLFAAALGLGLLCSPLLELSYLTVLFVPLAIVRRRLDVLWLLPAALWLAVPGALPQVVQIVFALIVLCAIVAVAAPGPRRPSPHAGVPAGGHASTTFV